MNIEILPPNINESFGGFTIIEDTAEKRAIRFGFYTIKNLGTDISDAIILERKNKGKFKSITDFLDRIKHKNLNKKSMEALIKSGSFDELGERGAMLANLEDMLAYNREAQEQNRNQVSLFGGIAELKAPEFKLKDAPEASKSERLIWEKELLGLYISGHPLDRIREKLEKRDVNIKKIKEEMGNGLPVTIAGIIETSRPIITKNNDRMVFIKIADFTGSIEAVAFPSIYKDENVNILVAEKCIALQGKISLRNGEKSIIIDAIKEV